MANSECNHFHKDCRYYSDCTEEVVYEGKQKYIKFTCPMFKYPQSYYCNDLHTIKWECTKFEPYQNNFLDSLN